MIRWGTLTSGLIGFVFVLTTGLGLGNEWGRTLISATIAALAFGLMGHWWMALWIRSMTEVLSQKTKFEGNAARNVTDSKVEGKAESREAPAAN